MAKEENTIKPNGGVAGKYYMFYAGAGYPSHDEVIQFGKKVGMSHIYFGSEGAAYHGIYNGDTNVLYEKLDDLPEAMRKDAEQALRSEENQKKWANQLQNDPDKRSVNLTLKETCVHPATDKLGNKGYSLQVPVASEQTVKFATVDYVHNFQVRSKENGFTNVYLGRASDAINVTIDDKKIQMRADELQHMNDEAKVLYQEKQSVRKQASRAAAADISVEEKFVSDPNMVV